MVAQSVLHGCDSSGTFANRPDNAPDGFLYWATDLRRLIVFDATLKIWAAADGGSLASGTYLFDDFRGNALEDSWVSVAGIDAQAVAPALDTDNEDGLVVGTTGNAGDTPANDAAALGRVPYLEAEEGELTFQTKFKLDAITTVAFYLGFTDTSPGATLEMPFTLSGTTFTSNATDAVGFLFDTAATTDTIRCVGVKNDVEVTHVNSALAPVADTYRTYKIVVTTAGTAKYYIDGTLIATIADAVSPGVDLTPIIIAVARTTASRTWTADYIHAA